MPHQFCKIIVVLFLTLAPVAKVSAQLDFMFNINPSLIDGETGLSTGVITAAEDAALNAALTNAGDFWGQYITGFKPGVTGLTGATIDVRLSNFATPGGVFDPDGVDGMLASASPAGFADNNGGFTFITDGNSGSGNGRVKGVVTIDTADFGNLGSSLFSNTLNHELAHAIGFGQLFDFMNNQLAVPGSGQYTGAWGLATYQDEFDPTATFVPLELDGGQGTANFHLNEVANFSATLEDIGSTGENDPGDVLGSALTVLVPGPTFGNSADNALLTGRIDPSLSPFLSNTTVAIFEDLGYSVVLPNPIVAVPEPAAVSLLAICLLGVAGQRRRRS